jgi:hypothetical protein
MSELDSPVDHVIAVLGKQVFFGIIMVSGLGKLSQTCKAYRYLQLQKEVVLAAILGSTEAKCNFECRLSLFAMMPQSIENSSARAIGLLRVARAYERNVIANRRYIYPTFYAYAYYSGICGSSQRGRREQVWKEIASILSEMLQRDEEIGSEPVLMFFFFQLAPASRRPETHDQNRVFLMTQNEVGRLMRFFLTSQCVEDSGVEHLALHFCSWAPLRGHGVVLSCGLELA